MQITKISYGISIQVHEGLWVKLGAEADLSPNDDYELSFDKLRDNIEAMQKKFAQPKLVPISEALGITQVDKSSKDKAIDSMIEAINGCSSIGNLETFKKLVDRENVPKITEAYYKKQQILSNGND